MSAVPGVCSENGFVAPRVKRGILTPTTESALNVSDGPTRSSKKRKWSSGALEDLLEEPFLIRVGFKLEYQSFPFTDYAHYKFPPTDASFFGPRRGHEVDADTSSSPVSPPAVLSRSCNSLHRASNCTVVLSTCSSIRVSRA